MNRYHHDQNHNGKQAIATSCKRIKVLLLIWPLMVVGIFSSHAELSLPSCFSDHMVLQQNDGSRRSNTSLIWGQADPGDRIQIEFNGKKYPRFARKTPKSGQWEIPLSKLKPGGPYHLKITARNSKKEITTKTLRDVMVGMSGSLEDNSTVVSSQIRVENMYWLNHPA